MQPYVPSIHPNWLELCRAYLFFQICFGSMWLFLKFNFVIGPLRGKLLCASEGIQYHLIKLLLQTQRKQSMWTQDNPLYKQGVL